MNTSIKSSLNTWTCSILGTVVVSLGLISYIKVADAVPNGGSFSGQGQASGAVFANGKQANASLDFNGRNYNVGLVSGRKSEVRYIGTINQLRGTNSRNPNSFVLRGQVQSFATSTTNLRVANTKGTCRIEVFDMRIKSISCSTKVADSFTRFTGMSQF